MNSTPLPSQEYLDQLSARLRQVLDPELLNPPYKEQWSEENPTLGFCSVASEAAWFVLGGKDAGWVAHSAREENGSTHWWLEHTSGLRFDPTVEQYTQVGNAPPYERSIKSTPGGFMGIRKDETSAWGLPYRPSKRAQVLLTRLQELEAPTPRKRLKP